MEMLKVGLGNIRNGKMMVVMLRDEVTQYQARRVAGA